MMTLARDLDPMLLDHVEPPLAARLDDGTPDARASLAGLLAGLPRDVLPRMAVARLWRLAYARR